MDTSCHLENVLNKNWGEGKEYSLSLRETEKNIIALTKPQEHLKKLLIIIFYRKAAHTLKQGV